MQSSIWRRTVIPISVKKHPDEARQLNVEPVHTLDACLPDDVPLLFASTDYVFDGTSPPYVESDRVGPVNVYGQTKVDAESVVLARTTGIVLRMPLLIGAGATWDTSGFISQMWDSVSHKVRQSQDNVLQRFPTWTRDVANVMGWLLKHEQSGLFHISGLRGHTRYQWMLEFGSLVGESTDHLVPSTDVIPRLASRPFDSQLRPCRLQSMGYRGFTDFSDVVKEVMASFSQPPFEDFGK